MNKEQQERVNKESRGRACNAKEEKGRDSFRAKFQLSRGGIYSRFWLAHRGPPSTCGSAGLFTIYIFVPRVDDKRRQSLRYSTTSGKRIGVNGQ